MDLTTIFHLGNIPERFAKHLLCVWLMSPVNMHNLPQVSMVKTQALVSETRAWNSCPVTY